MAGKNSLPHANCLLQIAKVHFRLKQITQALDIYEIVSNIYLVELGKNHIKTYKIQLNLLEMSYLLQNQYKIQFYEDKLRQILDQNYDENTFVVANEMGNLLRKYHQYQQSIVSYCKALEIHSALPNKMLFMQQVVLVLSNIASTYIIIGDRQQVRLCCH